MNRPFLLFIAVFIVMALSNAIVPVLPLLSDDLSFSDAYLLCTLFGAMVNAASGYCK